MICRKMIETEGLDKAFSVGDVISFELTDGEAMEAMAVKEEADGMIFCAVDCLEKEYPMLLEDDASKDYEASDLRNELNGSIIERFPAELRAVMIPFENGDMLRVPTEKEIFGKNEYGADEPESVTQWEPMKLRRNSIAFQGSNGAWEWYWLQNKFRAPVSGTYFADVYTYGNCGYSGASIAGVGVRPAFKISKS